MGARAALTAAMGSVLAIVPEALVSIAVPHSHSSTYCLLAMSPSDLSFAGSAYGTTEACC
jgi:hypothetical protein